MVHTHRLPVINISPESGTFVTFSGPTLTYHCYSKSIADVRVHSWCIAYGYTCHWASLVAQLIKNLPAMREIWVRSLSWEDPLEKGMATNSNILAWRNPMDRGACPQRNSPMTEFLGSQRVGHDWATSLSFFLRLRRAQNLQVQSKWIIGIPGWASGWEVHLPVRTRSLLWEDSTCCGATKLYTTTAEPTL